MWRFEKGEMIYYISQLNSSLPVCERSSDGKFSRLHECPMNWLNAPRKLFCYIPNLVCCFGIVSDFDQDGALFVMLSVNELLYFVRIELSDPCLLKLRNGEVEESNGRVWKVEEYMKQLKSRF